MDYQIERPSPCHLVFNATVPVGRVSEAREQVVASYLRRAKVPGFRPGKAPRPIVERRFAEEIRTDVQDRLLHDLWREISENERIRPTSTGIGVDGHWEDDGTYAVKGEVEVYAEVELADETSFVPPEFPVEPDEGEVDAAIAQLRERQAVWEPVADGTADEDLLVEAEVNGEFSDGGGEPFHEERSLFQVGHGEVYPEIEAAVRGKAVGDEVTAEREVGKEGGEGREGKRITYRITIKGLRRKLVPEADEAFAHSLGVEDGMRALRERVLSQLQVEKARLRRDVWRAALVRHLAGGNELALPESVVVEETRKELVSFANSLASRGVDPSQAEVDWQKAQGEARAHVEDRLRAELVLDAFAEKLGLTVSDEEMNDELEHQALRMHVPFAELKGNLAKSGGLERVRRMLRRERAVDERLGRSTPAESSEERA
jgi:trigger factor